MLYLLTNKTVLVMVADARQSNFDEVLESARTLAKNCKGQPVLDLAVSLVALQEANEAQSVPDLCEWDAAQPVQTELARLAFDREKDTLHLCLNLVEQHGEWGKKVVEQILGALSDEDQPLHDQLDQLIRHAELRAEILEAATVPTED